MKTRFLIQFVFLLTLITNICYSQPSITWCKLYDSPYHNDDGALSISPSNNGNYFVFGYAYSGIHHAYLIKINDFGDTLWTKFYPQLNYFKTSVSNSDGSCVFAGKSDHTFFAKIDSSGNILWQNNYNIDFTTITDLRKTSDSGYIACGYHDAFTNSYILKIKSTGELQWQKVFSVPYSSWLTTVSESFDGGYIASGFTKFSAVDTSRIVLVKVDSAGSTQWQKNFRISNKSSYVSLISKLNNNYLLCGWTLDSINIDNPDRIFVSRIDLSGNLISYNVLSFYTNDVFEV